MSTSKDLSHLTLAQAVDRARAIAAELPARRAETERLRRIPSATMAAFVESGLMRMNQARRWGGAELGTRAVVEVVSEIAKGDPSAGWVLGLIASHFWLGSLFSEEAQEEMWGRDPGAMMSSSFVAQESRCERVEGGFRISGRWPFSSGADHCSWAMFGIFLPPGGPGEPPLVRWGLLPRAEYEVEDTWKTCALRGTGSNTLVVKDAFVPDHRTLDPATVAAGSSPGASIHRSPLFRVPFGAALVSYLSAPALGAAELAFGEYRADIAKRRSMFSGEEIVRQMPTLVRIGELSAQLDAARLVLTNAATLLDDALASGAPPSPELAARVGRDATYVVRRCVDAAETCMRFSGGGGLFESHPVQQAWRDVHGIAAHLGFNTDFTFGLAGQRLMGLPLPPSMF